MPEEIILADVVSVLPNKIKISVDTWKIASWNQHEEKLRVWSYLEVQDHESTDVRLLAVIENFSIQLIEKKIPNDNGDFITITERLYYIEAMPLWTLSEDSDGKIIFNRWGNEITIPPKWARPASKEDIEIIYNWCLESNERFSFSSLSQDSSIRVTINGNRFFNKHFAIVGSTGSGKSHTVAKILQKATSERGWEYSGMNNSHIVLFDIHGEYHTAFPEARKLDITNLVLPYWLLSGDELQDLLIDSEANDHNQRNVLKECVVKSKKVLFTWDSAVKELIHYDSPYLFSIMDVLASVKAKDEEMITWARGEKQGPLFWKLSNFVSRLENKLEDKRLSFLFWENSKNISLQDTLKQLIGYKDWEESNVTLLDLSGVPFEVLSVTVSLISRILFQYWYFYKRHLSWSETETPLLLVYEEAHKYVPKNGGAKYNAAKDAIERIAKEWRKYGVTLGIVSQRPSEISETIFSQCSNFIAMRLTNPEDQNYVKRLLPDSMGGIVDMIPTLRTWEAILIWDSVTLPSVIKMDECDADKKPNSMDVKYLEIWKKEWKNVDFSILEAEWKK